MLARALSSTTESAFCVEAALVLCEPVVFNNDQGGQFTSGAVTVPLSARRIFISFQGRAGGSRLRSARAEQRVWDRALFRPPKEPIRGTR